MSRITLVMALEMFAENSLLVKPSTCLAGFEDVRFGLPVKLLKGEMKVRVVAKLQDSDGDIHRMKVYFSI